MSITLTEKAVSQINEVIAANDLEGYVVRVSAKAADGEVEYELDIVDEVVDADRRLESRGLEVVCDPASYLWAKGATVDFVESAGGFVFVNPRHPS